MMEAIDQGMECVLVAGSRRVRVRAGVPASSANFANRRHSLPAVGTAGRVYDYSKMEKVRQPIWCTLGAL